MKSSRLRSGPRAPAGRIHLKRLSRITVNRKSNSIDLVTEADREFGSRDYRTDPSRVFPTHAILAEESGASAHQSDHRWIIDPLDGTTNFAHGYPQFCVSIAYERRGTCRIRRGLRFAQERMLSSRSADAAARLNGKPIRVSNDAESRRLAAQHRVFRMIAASGAASTYASGKN